MSLLDVPCRVARCWLFRPLIFSALLGCTPYLFALELGGRLSLRGSITDLHRNDLARESAGATSMGAAADLRVSAEHRQGAFIFRIDGELSGIGGDPFQFARRTGSDANNDAPRLFDFKKDLGATGRGKSGARARLDRFLVRYEKGDYQLTIGREAVSFGHGLIFQPMDLFSPFSPTEVDRDYKAGDDLIQFQKLFTDGSDLTVLAIGHRNQQGQADARDSTYGVRYNRFIGSTEVSVLSGWHFDDPVLALGASRGIGGAVIRGDIVMIRHRDQVATSLVLNADYSITVAQKNLYLFAEYYRNGFGNRNPESNVQSIDADVIRRLQRGEIFTFGKHYLGAGMRLEWHPLVNQSVLWIQSLNDGSQILQSAIAVLPTDNQLLELSITAGVGKRGKEFGPLELLPATPGRSSPTTGGDTTMLLRYVRYF